jgi:predicted nucleic acid-binding protein
MLIDSDAFIGLIMEADIHNKRVKAAFQEIGKANRVLAATNLVIIETTAMLSRRVNYTLACRFLEFIQDGDIPIIYIDKAMQDAMHTLFLVQNREKTSPVDCANVVVAKQLGIPSIFSFDNFYKNFGLKLVG